MKTIDTAKAFRLRINRAKTVGELKELDVRVTRFYDLGLLTSGDLSRLDVRIMERIVETEAGQ